jgi:hypothetical protein
LQGDLPVYSHVQCAVCGAIHTNFGGFIWPRSRWSPNEKTLVQINAWLIKRYKAYASRLTPTMAAAQ